MSRRQKAGRRPVTRSERERFVSALAAQVGQTPEEVTEHLRSAVEHGWLIETPDGWQASLPANIAPGDWTGPVT